MPRAPYIYLVVFDGPWGRSQPLAAFTVKHEALSWIAKQEDRDGMILHRSRDGKDYLPVVVEYGEN